MGKMSVYPVYDAAVNTFVELAGPELRRAHQAVPVFHAEGPGMPAVAAPVDEAHVTRVYFFSERGVPHKCGQKYLVTQACMAEDLLQPVFLGDNVAGQLVSDAEPLGCGAEIHILVDAVSYGFLQIFESVVQKVGQKVTRTFREKGIIMESVSRVIFHLPEVDEFGSAVLIEEGVYGVLILYRQVHAGKQMIVVIPAPGGSGFEQGQLASHDTYASPVDPEPAVQEVQAGVSAHTCPVLGTERGFPVYVNEDVVARVVQQRNQLTELTGVLMSQYQICVTFHKTNISVIFQGFEGIPDFQHQHCRRCHVMAAQPGDCLAVGRYCGMAVQNSVCLRIMQHGLFQL